MSKELNEWNNQVSNEQSLSHRSSNKIKDISDSLLQSLQEYFQSFSSLAFVSADFRKILSGAICSSETGQKTIDCVLSTGAKVWPTQPSLEKVSLSANGAAATRLMRSVG